MLVTSRTIFVCALSLWCALGAQAQSLTERVAVVAGRTADLEFPTEATQPGLFSQPRMAILKPAGDGPFPAVVLQHQCGGLRSPSGWQNQSMLDWARRAVAQGYVAMLVDSLGPRSVDSVCMGPKGGVNFFVGVKDAYQAAEHLRQQRYVDPKRIVWAGYSWGAMVATLGSSRAVAKAFEPMEKFRAVVAFYPGCTTIGPTTGTPYEIVHNDIETPLLMLMGELDNETPPAPCVEKLQAAQAQGAPVQWHVYPDTTHCWDCANLHGFRKVDVRGTSVQYLYRQDHTENAAQRMFAFFALALKP